MYKRQIYALTAAIDTKDHYTFSHSKNVSAYATNFARCYGLTGESVAIIQEAGLLHDIGKIGVPEHIPVSYTHLDVYKRQTQCIMEKFF